MAATASAREVSSTCTQGAPLKSPDSRITAVRTPVSQIRRMVRAFNFFSRGVFGALDSIPIC